MYITLVNKRKNCFLPYESSGLKSDLTLSHVYEKNIYIIQIRLCYMFMKKIYISLKNSGKYD